MRKKGIFTINVAILVALAMSITSMSALAASNNIKSLINGIPASDVSKLNNSIREIYSNSVASLIIGHKSKLVTSQVSDQSITDATLSEPMPVFSSNVKYNKGEDFKSKLKLQGWQIIVYASNTPVAAFWVDDGKSGEYQVTNTLGENYAKGCDNSIKQLSQGMHAVLPASGYIFIGDSNDNISLATPADDSSASYPKKSFSELDAAVNKNIDYYSSQSELLLGGSVLLDYLYGSQTNGAANTTRNNIIIISLCSVGIVLICTSALVIHRKKHKKLCTK